MSERFRFGHLSVDKLSRVEAPQALLRCAEQGEGCLVVTSHIHHVCLSERDLEFRAAVAHAALNVPDGWPLLAASRVLRGPLVERVPGIDLVSAVLRAGNGLRVAILGGAPGAADALSRRLASDHDVVLVDPLPREAVEDGARIDELCRQLSDSAANLVLVGIGAPRQEILGARLAAHARGPVIGCGAAVNVLAGVVPRAPARLQRAGLEWAYRAVREPRRLGPRYAHDAFSFSRVLLREWRRTRKADRAGRSRRELERKTEVP